MSGGERAHSPYWGSLRQNLITSRASLWLYHRSDEVSWRDGRAFCAQNEGDRESHRLIDDFITIRTVVRSIGTYVRLCRAHKQLVLDVARTTSAFGGLAAQQLFRAALRDSLTGSHAVWAAVHAHTYQSVVHDRDVKRWFFLWENKAFEQSLISAAQRRGDVETIGYSHSVVRKQDNRYYNELRFVPVVGGRSRPTASRYAVNGALPIRNIQLVAPPDAPLCEVEALRYLSLSPREEETGDAVLVVGDISATESKRLVVATVAALADSNENRVVLFKPHPGNLSQTDTARALGCEVSTEPLGALAPLVSFAVVGVAGAASLDLTMLGVPVITLLDAHTTNLSPLAGVPGALFARDVADLRQFAQNARLGAVDVSSVMTRTQPPSRWLALLSGSQ
jgi:surface carbohydrate biosynthesis protein (TIGR04326 family)